METYAFFIANIPMRGFKYWQLSGWPGTQIEKIESLPAVTPRGIATDYELGHGSQALAGLRILVVDDEPDCATLTSYMLTQWGAEVKIAISAPEALEVFERYEEWPPTYWFPTSRCRALTATG